MRDFESVYEAYYSDVFRYAKSLTMDEPLADEITAETFFRALRSLSTFRGDCDIRVWLCHIAKNVWLTEQKRRSRFSEDETALELIAEKTDVAAVLFDKQESIRLHRMLHELPEPYKEVFSLRVFGELGFSQIGELFGKNQHWACVTYHRAKERLQKGMDNGNE